MTFSWPLVRRYATVSGIALLTLFVVWSVLWVVAAAQYRNLMDNWSAAEKARGHELTYDERHTGGYPGSVLLQFDNVRWDDKSGSQAHIGAVFFAAHPWNWRSFNVKLKHGFDLTLPYPTDSDPLTLHSDTGRAHVELNTGNSWDTIKLRLTAAEAYRPAHKMFTADELTLVAKRPTFAPKDHTETGLSVMARVRNMKLFTEHPTPFGDTVAHAEAALRVMGPLPSLDDKESIRHWNEESGVIEWDQFDLGWGPLELTTRGTLGLDDDLEPEGAFSGHIGGHEAVIKALLDSGCIAKRQAVMLQSALTLFAKPSSLIKQSGIEVPITLQLGGLFLGPVKIMSIPEICWPGSTVAAPAEAAPASPTPETMPAMALPH